jgi:hypothetical protein
LDRFDASHPPIEAIMPFTVALDAAGPAVSTLI